MQPVFNLKKRTFFDKFKVKTKDGVSFWLYNNAFYWETEMFWAGFENFDYERKSREVWCELVTKSRVILDIGSNTGWFSMMAQAYNSAVEIHAFELQPNVFDVLKKNVEINSFKVVCNPIALSDEVGSFPFYNTGDRTFLTENTNHGSLNKQWRLEKQRSIQVEVQRLDAYWSDKSKKIELIKIDVETFEYEVLKGYATLLFDTALSYYWKLRIKKSGEGLLRFSRTRNLVFFMFMKKMGFLRQ